MRKNTITRISIIFLTSIFLTSIIGTAQALGNGLTIETYTVTPFVDASTLTNMVPLVDTESKFVCDGYIRINHGTLRQLDYQGALGTGTLYLETLHSRSQEEIPNIQLTEVGEGVFQYTLEIDDGPYGMGTLKGIGKLEWVYSLPDFIYELWGTAKLVPVDGEMDINWVSIEVYQFLFDTWWTTTTVVS